MYCPSASFRVSRRWKLTSVCLKDRSNRTLIRMCELDRHRHLYHQNMQSQGRGHTVIPPADFCLKTTSGGVVFRRIPTASNSISNILFCSAVFVASTDYQLCPGRTASTGLLIKTIKSAVLATDTTCLPRPRPIHERGLTA